MYTQNTALGISNSLALLPNIMYMYVCKQLDGSVIVDIQYSVKWRGKHVTQSSELHAAHVFMRPKRVVMKIDKLLSVIVRRCEQHVYHKLTNKRSTDTLFIDKQ